MATTTTIFLFLLFGYLTVHSYFVYPLIMLVIGRGREHWASGERAALPVSVVIAAHNEEQVIVDKILDVYASGYSAENLEVLVASDASTDATEALVAGMDVPSLRLVRSDQRLGKEFAQSLAIQEIDQDRIVVFSDAKTRIGEGSLQRISTIFANNPDIGAISSEDRFVDSEQNASGEGAYVRYEMWVRSLESKVAGLVGLSGSFFAARRNVCNEWDTSIPSDFNVAMSAARQGFRSVSDPGVVGIYKTVANRDDEYGRKVRTVVRGCTALLRNLAMLNPLKYKVFAFQLWSHKVLRWLLPFFYVATFICALSLRKQHWIFLLASIALMILPGIAVIAYLRKDLLHHGAIRVAYFFVQANVAIVHAIVLLSVGKRIVTWTPSER